MWRIKQHYREHSRESFGPEYGIDFARYADPPNTGMDLDLTEKINNRLFTKFAEDFKELEIMVRNSFVIIKGKVADEVTKKNILQEIWSVSGVKEVINQLKIM